ncbi:MAG: hypothetical protein ACRCYN_11275, partial [Plesiomonas sp.]
MQCVKRMLALCFFTFYINLSWAVTQTISQDGVHAIYEYDDPEQMYAENAITLDTSSYDPTDANSNIIISLAIAPNSSTHYWSGTSNQSIPMAIYTEYSGCKALTGSDTTILHDHCPS